MGIEPDDLGIRDLVVIETEGRGGPVRLTAFVTDVLADELWLAATAPDTGVLDLQPGQLIHLTFDRDGALVVESEFLRHLGDARLGSPTCPLFAVRRPGGVESVQRRSHVRVDLERVVRIRSVGRAGPGHEGLGRTIDIGAGGIAFTTDMPLVVGAELKVALVVTPRDVIIAMGTVVRVGEVAAGSGPARPLIAVRFDKISEMDQERITCHILSAERQRRASPGAGAG